jgi:hypothetical protein
MPVIYLTPAAITYLNQSILALVITFYSIGAKLTYKRVKLLA